MKETDLRQAAHEAVSAWEAALPAGDVCPVEVSPEFEQRLQNRLAKERRSVVMMPLKRVACILLALVLVGGGTFAVSPAARAAVFSGWLWERTGNSILYLFQGKPSADQWGEYSLSNVPEGYYLLKEAFDDSDGYEIYQNNEGLRLNFEYVRKPQNGNAALAIYEQEDLTVYAIKIGETRGDFYFCEDGTTANSLVWTDEHTGTLFHLSGWFEKEVLIELANCINLVKLESF